MGASLLVFKNKSDVAGCMSSEEIGKVRGSLASRGGVPMFTKHDADSVNPRRPCGSTRFTRTGGTLWSAVH
jgi:hypothetical protein